MKAVLVFCEGDHDVVFVKRSLGACADCKWMDDQPMRKLPSPFGASRTLPKGLIAQRFDELAVEDLALEDDDRPTPQFSSLIVDAANEVMFALIRAGGKDKAQQVLRLVQYVDALMDAGGHEVSEHAVAFLFDADDEGLDTAVSAFRRDYAPYYGNLDGVAHAQWLSTKGVPVGLYVFHAEGKETGTLENHTAPMVADEWPDRYDAASRFIDGNSKPTHAVMRNEARRLKAVMTAAGQFDHPGRPLGTVLARNGLSVERYKASRAANDLASFLLSTPWRSTDSASDATVGAADAQQQS